MRELENTVERAVVLAPQPVIQAQRVVLVGARRARAAGLPSLNLKQNLEWTERETVRRALDAPAASRRTPRSSMGISQRA